MWSVYSQDFQTSRSPGPEETRKGPLACFTECCVSHLLPLDSGCLTRSRLQQCKLRHKTWLQTLLPPREVRFLCDQSELPHFWFDLEPVSKYIFSSAEKAIFGASGSTIRRTRANFGNGLTLVSDSSRCVDFLCSTGETNQFCHLHISH